jgi:hypothetical protein
MDLEQNGQTSVLLAGGGLQRAILGQAADNGGAGVLNAATIAGGLNNPYASLNRALFSYYAERQENDGVAANRVKCFVPFSLLFPALDELPDDGAVFTGFGQSVKMNLRTNLPADFVC